MINEQAQLIGIFYCVRHLESIQNVEQGKDKREGFEDTDSGLTAEGEEHAKNRPNLISIIGDKLSGVYVGKIKRQHQSLEPWVQDSGYEGDIIIDPRINAVFDGHLIQQKGEITDKQYNLGKRKFTFNAKQAGVFPFDPLYSDIYVDCGKRIEVFPGYSPEELELPTFAEIDDRFTGLHGDLVEKIRTVGQPQKYVVVGSCSSLGFNLEKARKGPRCECPGTIGLNMLTKFGSEGKPIFPMDHDDIHIIGYTMGDMDKGYKTLRAIEGNVDLRTYVQKHLMEQ